MYNMIYRKLMIIGSNVTAGWQLVPQGNSVCVGAFGKMSGSHCRRFRPSPHPLPLLLILPLFAVFLPFASVWKRKGNGCYAGYVKQIMTAKITTLRTLYVRVASNSVMFLQILYDIVLYARHFLPVKFFSEYYFYKLFRATEKCNVDRWITRVISTSTGTNEVRLAHHIS